MDLRIKHATKWSTAEAGPGDEWIGRELREDEGLFIEFLWKEVTVDGAPLDIARATSSECKTMDDLYERAIISSSRVRPFGAQPMTQVVSFPFVGTEDDSEAMFTPGPHLVAVKADVIWFDGRNGNASVVAVVPLKATRILCVRPTSGGLLSRPSRLALEV